MRAHLQTVSILLLLASCSTILSFILFFVIHMLWILSLTVICGVSAILTAVVIVFTWLHREATYVICRVRKDLLLLRALALFTISIHVSNSTLWNWRLFMLSLLWIKWFRALLWNTVFAIILNRRKSWVMLPRVPLAVGVIGLYHLLLFELLFEVSKTLGSPLFSRFNDILSN